MSEESAESVRRAVDAFNRRDRATWLALCDPDIEWRPPAEWPESAPIRGAEAVWDFMIQLD
jgi:ketosteroid isomerase-like protein